MCSTNHSLKYRSVTHWYYQHIIFFPFQHNVKVALRYLKVESRKQDNGRPFRLAVTYIVKSMQPPMIPLHKLPRVEQEVYYDAGRCLDNFNTAKNKSHTNSILEIVLPICHMMAAVSKFKQTSTYLSEVAESLWTLCGVLHVLNLPREIVSTKIACYSECHTFLQVETSVFHTTKLVKF